MRRILVVALLVTALAGVGGSAFAASRHVVKAQTAGKADLAKTVNVTASGSSSSCSAPRARREVW